MLVSASLFAQSTLATLKSVALWNPITTDTLGNPIQVTNYVVTLTPLGATNGLPALATNIVSGTNSILTFVGTNHGLARLWVAGKSPGGLLGLWTNVVINLDSLPAASSSLGVQLELNVIIAP